MLGRTDSRSRLLVLLLVFLLAAMAVIGRLAYWQVIQRDSLASKAVAQTTVQVTEPSRRGDIYDRSGTVVLATTVDRDRLVASTKLLTPQQQQLTGDTLVALLGLDEAGAMALRDKLASGKSYIHPGPRDRAGPVRPDPGRDRRRHADRHHPRGRAPAGLSAVRRRARLDPGRAASSASSIAKAPVSTVSNRNTRTPLPGRRGSRTSSATPAASRSPRPRTWSARARPARTSA